MTKKHFIKIANIINDSTLKDDKEYMRPIINKMSLIVSYALCLKMITSCLIRINLLMLVKVAHCLQ